MSVRIRLARGGTKKRPFYRIVATDKRSPRDGRFLEKLGSYNPLLPKDNENRVVLREDRVRHWLAAGASSVRPGLPISRRRRHHREYGETAWHRQARRRDRGEKG